MIVIMTIILIKIATITPVIKPLLNVALFVLGGNLDVGPLIFVGLGKEVEVMESSEE